MSCVRSWRRPRTACSAGRRGHGRMLTVESLTSELGLKLAAGREQAAEREIRWVHISELQDPTPWLSGGELLLTTGIQLEDADRQTELVRLLAGREVAGLGFGTGFNHAKLPEGARQGGRRVGLAPVRGSLQGPVHPDHRGGREPPRQRAVRRALARDRRQRTARAARARRGRAARDRARDRAGDRRKLGCPGFQGRGTGPGRPAPGRGAQRGDSQRGPEQGIRRRTVRPRSRRAATTAPSRTRYRRAAATPRRGWSSSAGRASSETSSVSASSRQRSSWRWS